MRLEGNLLGKSMQAITIVGSGLAGYTLAKEIRKLDTDIPVRVVTSDNGSFYSKPMLSNALAKNQTPEYLATMNAAKMAETNNLEIVNHCTVTAIDRENNTLQTDKGDYDYTCLVLATGANPIRIPIEGNAAEEVLSVNSLDDYALFRKKLEGKKSVAILGAGLIGCEFANDLSASGFDVDLIDLADQPLGRLLPKQSASRLKDELSNIGISWHLGCSLTSVNKIQSNYELSLSDGSTITSDLVLSAIGLRSEISLAKESGLETNRGIVTNNLLQTSDSDIFALGDCAEINGMVLPFVMPIMIGARALAKTVLGETTEINYPAMPVVVKTPAFPTVVCPPAPGSEGEWQEDTIGNGIKATYVNGDKLLGFALTGDAVSEKQALSKLISI